MWLTMVFFVAVVVVVVVAVVWTLDTHTHTHRESCLPSYVIRFMNEFFFEKKSGSNDIINNIETETWGEKYTQK